MSLVGRLSVVGAGRPPGPIPEEAVLRESRRERTLAVVARNLGRPCPEERDILARQVVAGAQAREIRVRVEALALKGLDLAHHLYPSPALRDMGDLDLLVRRADVRRADAALRALGYRPDRDPEPSGGGFLNSALYFRDGGLPVHLHWHVSNASLPHGMYRVDVDEIWREASDGALAPHHRVVTLCEHALKHSFDALIHLADIELASRGADWPRVAESARRWGLERAVGYALVLVRDVLGVRSPGLAFFETTRPGPEGGVLLAQARARRSRGVSALGLLSMASSRIRFIRDAVSPPGAERGGLSTRSAAGRAARALSSLLS